MSVNNESAAATIDEAAGQGFFSALRYRDFRLLWLGQFISITGSQMQLVAINWHVYLLTKSALALGFVGLARVLPIIICSLAGGVLADAINRKRLMLMTQTVMLASAALLALATIKGLQSVWPIYLLTAIASAATAFDNPARQALLPSLVPARHFANAVSLGMVVFQIATITGPVLAGFILSTTVGPAAVYAVNALTFLAVISALMLMHTSGALSQENQSTGMNLGALREGLGFVWRTPIIVQTMVLDFIATFFASATALLPIYATEILHVNARGYSLLFAAPATGAVVTGLLMTRFGKFERQGLTVIIAVGVYGAATLGFGLSHIFWVSLVMLAISGAADTVSTVLRQTIRQLVTPDYLRGRMTSVNMIFFMGGPQLGELEAGVVASAFGAPVAVISGGIGCLLAVGIALFKSKSLVNYQRQE